MDGDVGNGHCVCIYVLLCFVYTHVCTVILITTGWAFECSNKRKPGGSGGAGWGGTPLVQGVFSRDVVHGSTCYVCACACIRESCGT